MIAIFDGVVPRGGFACSIAANAERGEIGQVFVDFLEAITLGKVVCFGAGRDNRELNRRKSSCRGLGR